MTDDALIEAIARHFIKQNAIKPYTRWDDAARDALAVARPVIERETRERCAKIAGAFAPVHPLAETIAAAIRRDGDE